MTTEQSPVCACGHPAREHHYVGQAMSDCPDLPTAAEQAWEAWLNSKDKFGRFRSKNYNAHERAMWLAGFDAACPTPSTEQIARVLAEHRHLDKFDREGLSVTVSHVCSCEKWTHPSGSRWPESHRAHVAASVLAHLYGEGSDAGPDSGTTITDQEPPRGA
jgi:hypothetical protein